MKRFASMILVLILALSCYVSVSAAAGVGVSPLASPTISTTSATSYTGDSTGEVDFDFTITPTDTATKLGVSSLVIHKPDGSTVTITGTTANGLLGSGLVHAGTYTYKGVSGQYYYADVTFISTIGSVSDTKTVTTKSAKAK